MTPAAATTVVRPVKTNPSDLRKLMIVVCGCACFFMLVLITLLGIYNGRIQPEDLGTIESLTVGGGILGLGLITYHVIKLGVSQKGAE